MKLEVFEDAEAVARAAAATIAADARAAVAARGRFIMAVSGGHTPWIMLRALANEEVPWKDVHVFQVDERIAPAGDPDRNLTHLRASLLEHAPLPPQQIYAMPVELPDLEAAAKQYAQTLEQVAGSPPVLDLAHLGMGPDGHTASLVPGDPVLAVTDADVGLTGVYMGRRRMTLTYPVLNRSLRILWLMSGLTGTVTSATLRIFPTSSPSTGFTVFSVADNTWGETTIVDANAPPFGASLGTSGPASTGIWTNVNVTSVVVGNGQVSFGLSTTNSTALALSAREGANPPQLVITTTP